MKSVYLCQFSPVKLDYSFISTEWYPCPVLTIQYSPNWTRKSKGVVPSKFYKSICQNGCLCRCNSHIYSPLLAFIIYSLLLFTHSYYLLALIIYSLLLFTSNLDLAWRSTMRSGASCPPSDL